jgi:hypothetical protein
MTSLASSFALPPHGSTSHLHKNNIVETKERKKYAAVDTVPPSPSLSLSLATTPNSPSLLLISRRREPESQKKKKKKRRRDL